MEELFGSGYSSAYGVRTGRFCRFNFFVNIKKIVVEIKLFFGIANQVGFSSCESFRS